MKHRFLFPILALLSASLLSLPPLHAQADPDFRIDTIQRTAQGELEFTFRDAETEATGHFIQSSTDLAPDNWLPVPEALITDLGGGVYGVVIEAPAGPRAFYRVVRIGPDGETVIANFSTATLEVTEGETAFAIITFSAPFTGTLRYTLSGTATSDDFEELSGEVFVSNSTQAVIPVTIKENTTIDPVRNLILTIQADGGAAPGLVSQFEILVKDADARWEGSFLSGSASIPFTLDLIRTGDTTEGFLIGGPFGFLPEESTTTTVTQTPTSFAASTAEIAMPAEATLLDLPALLQLELIAVDGEPDEEVGADFIQGRATLTTTYPGNAHLNTTAEGMFLMQRTPPPPSTSEITLFDAP